MDNFLIQNFRFITTSIALGTLAVLFIYWLLNRSPVSGWFKASGGMVASFITIPAFLFGLVISTIVSGVGNSHQIANASLVNESTAIRTLISISTTLRADDQIKLNSAIQNYVNAIVTKEWPNMKNPEHGAQGGASSEFRALKVIVNNIVLETNQRNSNRLELMIDNLRHERLLRQSLAFNGSNFARWPSIFVLSFLLLFTVGLLQLENPSAMKISLIMGALCIVTATVFLFINMSPYRGFNAIEPNILIDSLNPSL